MLKADKTCEHCGNQDFCKHMTAFEKYLSKIQEQDFITISCNYYRQKPNAPIEHGYDNKNN